MYIDNKMSVVGVSVEIPNIVLPGNGKFILTNWTLNPTKDEFNTGNFNLVTGVFTAPDTNIYVVSIKLIVESPISANDSTFPVLLVLLNGHVAKEQEVQVPLTGSFEQINLAITTSMSLKRRDTLAFAIKNTPNKSRNVININNRTYAFINLGIEESLVKTCLIL